MVLLRSRIASMPSDNIDRAIKRGTGGADTSTYEDQTYEIYGPGGVAILAELSTDNRNRTAAEIRSILTKNGGSIATSGAVTRLFHRKGQIIVSRDAANEDTLMELALEAGADDFRAEPEGYEILTDPAQFEAVHKALDARQIKSDSAQITFIADLMVPVAPSTEPAVSKLIEAIEDHDDVKEVYSNAEYAD
jgi:YebC/PmpR family DNA-binding regulatory protein